MHPSRARSAAAPLTVAHFRRVWFLPTETFLHATLANLRATRARLVGYTRERERDFPVPWEVTSLYPPGSWSERALRLRVRLLGPRGHPHFDHPRTYAALEDSGAQVLHAHFGYTGVHLLPVARRTGLPLVTTFYGEDASRQADEPEWRERYRELFERGDCFLVEGPFMRGRLAEIGCPLRKSVVQRIGIHPERYPFRARAPRPRGEPVRLLFCASFREKKGLGYALEAVARVREEFPRLVFRIGGDGPLGPDVRATVRDLGLEDAVELLGFLPHARFVEELDAADLFIQPSVTARDGDSEGGAPTTLLEAQACGVPVLSTRHADIPAVVAEGESALLASERDVDGLAAHLLTLLKEPERWAAMGGAGRVHVERFHDVRSETDRLESLYAELAGAPLGGGGDA